MIVCREDEKPLAVMQLLSSIPSGQQILCFTASIESTHRLALLLQILQNSTQAAVSTSIIEYSSSLSQQERDKLMSAVKQGRSALCVLVVLLLSRCSVDVVVTNAPFISHGRIICSDVMSRGLDIQDIGTVINYDSPSHVKVRTPILCLCFPTYLPTTIDLWMANHMQTYVHRVGRTARAGRSGRCYTLLRQEEVWYFKQMLKKAENASQINEKLSLDFITSLEEPYKVCLSVSLACTNHL
jgi:ATP-dependent RNA helicase DDX51/DBP6